MAKQSKKQAQGVSPEALANYQRQCQAIASDWQRLHALARAYHQPEVNKEQLEWDLIAIKSRLSCDYDVLTRWRKGGYGLTGGVNKMLANTANLASIADAAPNPESRFNQTWKEVHGALQKVGGALQAAQAQYQRGKPAVLPAELLEQDLRRPFPVKKIFKWAGVVMAVLLFAGGMYVMRNFFGFWAPGAGAGIVVNDAMSDEDKIESVLVIMNEAFVQDDVDMFMTVVADDFRDDEGNGKTALRVFMQAYHEQGDFKAVRVDWSQMKLSEEDGYIFARPIMITTVDDNFSIHLGFKSYGGKLLIATGTAP